MKKRFIFVFAVLISFALFAQEITDPSKVSETEEQSYIGKEIANTIGAVKTANPGDYIILKSGKRYVLTKEEIEIANDSFNFENLSEVAAVYRDDGTEVKIISQAHEVYTYPDGQFAHLIKTGVSFSSYMRYIENKYYIALYNDYYNELYEFGPLSSSPFTVFRALIQIQMASNGIDEMQTVTVFVYNDNGFNYMKRYCTLPDMIWGYIDPEGAYTPVGEARDLEFDIQ